jgi:hypothetical protein
VSAVEQRNRKEVEQSDQDRENGGELNDGNEAAADPAAMQSALPDLPRNLDDAGRPAQLIRRFAADHNTDQIGDGIVDHKPLFPQVLFSIIYFPATGRSARVGELLLLAGATAAATVSISAIWPTLGPVAAHGGGDVVYLRDLLALRAGGPWHFELSAMQGIVTMPSYHTVQAVLLTYAFRRTGLVGYGIATLNFAMLLSIPPIGGHYLVDMLAGGAPALGTIAVQRAQRHGVSRILLGLGRETLVGRGWWVVASR